MQTKIESNICSFEFLLTHAPHTLVEIPFFPPPTLNFHVPFEILVNQQKRDRQSLFHIHRRNSMISEKGKKNNCTDERLKLMIQVDYAISIWKCLHLPESMFDIFPFNISSFSLLIVPDFISKICLRHAREQNSDFRNQGRKLSVYSKSSGVMRPLKGRYQGFNAVGLEQTTREF